MSIASTSKRVLEGVVISNKMQKTIVITVVTRQPHAMYGKSIIKRKKYKAHDEKNEAKIGDKVKIIECRPYSKEKTFQLLEILKQR